MAKVRRAGPRASQESDPPQAGVGLLAGRRPVAILTVAAIVAAVALCLALRARQYTVDPAIPLLPVAKGGIWIRPAEAFDLQVQKDMDVEAGFLTEFTLDQTLPGATVEVCAFRSFQAVLDGRIVYDSDDHPQSWKTPAVVRLPGPIAAGRHRFGVMVKNHGGRPCLWTRCRQLPLDTSLRWQATYDARRMQGVIAADDATPPDLVMGYPRVVEAIRSTGPWLLAVFAAGLAWTLWLGPIARRRTGFEVTPRGVRWALLAAWCGLAVNNIWQVWWDAGYDYRSHFIYVELVAKTWRLPHPTTSWQTFQPPLYYLLSAAIYRLAEPLVSVAGMFKALRIVPLVCGLIQIELVYRTARRVFPASPDLQTIALLVGGAIPMQIAMCQVIGNEPLAAVFTSATLLLCCELIVEPARSRSWKFFAATGAVWGLALLSKVTPLLLAPCVVAAIAWSSRAGGATWRTMATRLTTTAASCLAVSGWFFARNWVLVGTPISLGWDAASSGNLWWQDPSYRTWSQLARFGAALDRPLYSGVWSFWDAVYSTMWCDGFTSGCYWLPTHFLWNLNALTTCAWTGVLPTLLILASAATLWRSELRRSRGALLLAWAAISIYVAALIDLFLKLPVYSTAKASYLLGLLPMFGILAAAGASPLLANRWLRAIVLAGLLAAAVCAYSAFFVVVGWR